MNASAIDPRGLALALGGEMAGQNRIVAPGPGHSREDRSLSILLDPNAPDGFLVKSFADDNPIECRDHVRSRAGLSRWQPRGGTLARPAPAPGVRPLVEPGPDEESRKRRASQLWEQGRDPRETVVQTYLASRGLDLPNDVAVQVLRFHPACPWRNDVGDLVKVPAMIAAMRSIRQNELTGVHRTALSPQGAKIGRKMLGMASGAAIKLDHDDSVTMGLTIGEGVETTLAARQLGFRPAWALGSVGAIGAFAVLPGIDALTLLRESDKTGANERAVNECGTRWHDAGRQVILVSPKIGGDLNDALQGVRR